MIKLENILVPFVDSPSSIGALKTAAVMSKIHHAKLFVLHVNTDRTPNNLLDTIQHICTQEQVKFTFMERSGNISRAINKAEKEIDADMIIMGAYGITGWQQFWVGSNAFKVISTSECPVITLQNDCNGFNGFHKILLPLDDSEETRQKVNWVLKLAKGFDAEVLVLKTSKSNREETKSRLGVYAQQVETLLNREGIRSETTESYGQNVSENCIKTGQLHQCDLISIMTETENSNSFFMGTYAQQLVSTSPIPVMSIHAKNVGKQTTTGY